ncbi:hypothetical protein [Kitasatospora sp. MMS16-BH015]|uniref:hypothetical protein n=1 Tax=Kitasatospora sp. MMS16-BH015 TaxID=2018025 RepID=UPI001580C157|nr:hypothetical protein [Kitasatospora sp. MMS16-BH015]
MNLDFSAEPLFSWYVLLLFVSGVAMLAIAAANTGALSTGWRIFNAVAGVGFVGYGVYLGFVFQGGSYIIFFKAFILPVVMIVNFCRGLAAKRTAQQQAARAGQQAFARPTVPVQDAAPAEPTVGQAG